MLNFKRCVIALNWYEIKLFTFETLWFNLLLFNYQKNKCYF